MSSINVINLIYSFKKVCFLCVCFVCLFACLFSVCLFVVVFLCVDFVEQLTSKEKDK